MCVHYNGCYLPDNIWLKDDILLFDGFCKSSCTYKQQKFKVFYRDQVNYLLFRNILNSSSFSCLSNGMKRYKSISLQMVTMYLESLSCKGHWDSPCMFCCEILGLLGKDKQTSLVSCSGYASMGPKQNLLYTKSAFWATANITPYLVQRISMMFTWGPLKGCVLHGKPPCKDSIWGETVAQSSSETAEEGWGLASKTEVAAGGVWLAACKLTERIF